MANDYKHKYRKTSESSSDCSKPVVSKNDCCGAINEAIGCYYIALAEAVQRGSAVLVENFVDPVERAQRAGLALTYLSQLGILVGTALSNLRRYNCEVECCSEAALAIQNIAIGFANNILSLVVSPLLPLAQTEQALKQLIVQFNEALDVVFVYGTSRNKRCCK